MKHLIKQTTALTITNIVTRVMGMLYFILLARLLSVSDYGLFRYLMTIAIIYGILFTGIPTALTKFMSEDKTNKKEISEYVSNSLILMVAAFLILIVIILISNSNSLYLILFLFAVFIDTLYLGFVRGLLNYVKLSGFKLTENIIQLSILIISFIIYREVNFTLSVIFFSFSGLISLFIFEISKFEFDIHFKYDKIKISKLIKYAIPITIGAIGWEVMFGINTIFIQKFYSIEQVGYYSIGITLVQIFTFLPAAISTIMLPKVASTKRKERITKYIKIAVIGSLLISAIMLMFLLIFKLWILKAIFTSKYLQAALHIGKSIFVNLKKLREAVEIEMILIDDEGILVRGYFLK